MALRMKKMHRKGAIWSQAVLEISFGKFSIRGAVIEVLVHIKIFSSIQELKNCMLKDST